MIRIAICDDNIRTTSEIEKLLLKLGKKKIIGMEIEIFYDGLALEESVESGKSYDLLYLDIEMKQRNGIDAAKTIRKLDRNVVIIYVSSYESYFIELFEVEPFRFLKKPINETIFEQYFCLAYEKIADIDTYFEFKFNKKMVKIPINDIIYFESKGRTIHIYTTKQNEKYYGKLNYVEKSLQSSKLTFLRIHQSYLVNFKYISKMGPNKIQLYNSLELQISTERQKDIREKYMDLIGGNFLG